MKKGRNHTRKESQAAKHLIIGVIMFAAIQFAFIALASILILNNTINEKSTNWVVLAGTILSTFISGLMTLKIKDTERLKTASLLTGILIVIVILISFALNGSILSTWKCDVCILIGISATLFVRPKRNTRKKKIKVH